MVRPQAQEITLGLYLKYGTYQLCLWENLFRFSIFMRNNQDTIALSIWPDTYRNSVHEGYFYDGCCYDFLKLNEWTQVEMGFESNWND